MCFIEWKSYGLDKILMKYVSQGLDHDQSTLAEVIMSGKKPWPEPMLTNILGTTWLQV